MENSKLLAAEHCWEGRGKARRGKAKGKETVYLIIGGQKSGSLCTASIAGREEDGVCFSVTHGFPDIGIAAARSTALLFPGFRGPRHSGINSRRGSRACE